VKDEYGLPVDWVVLFQASKRRSIALRPKATPARSVCLFGGAPSRARNGGCYL